MLPNDEIKKKFLELLTKMTNVFNDFYIFDTGYCITMDKSKPYVILLNYERLNMVEEVFGKFKLLHIKDNRRYRKVVKLLLEEELTEEQHKGLMEEITWYFEIVESESEKHEVSDRLDMLLNFLNDGNDWRDLKFDDDDEKNQRIITTLFKDNGYYIFQPKSNSKVPDIILTKAAFPLMNEKNWMESKYCVEQMNDDIFVLITKWDYPLFTIWGYRFYIEYKHEMMNLL